MRTIDIEPEIEQEYTFIKNFTLRQSLCGLLVISLCLFFYFLVKRWEVAFVCVLPFALVAFIFGWWKENGLKAEDLAIQILQKHFYKNVGRASRVKNKYILVANRIYKGWKQADLKDKKVKAAIKAQKKKSRIKSYKG